MLAEIQALLAPTAYGNRPPLQQRLLTSAGGHAPGGAGEAGGLKVSACDAYMNINRRLEPGRARRRSCGHSGSGLQLSGPAHCGGSGAIGEVGLTGELRAVNNLDQRLTEVRRLGFKTCVVHQGGEEPRAPGGPAVVEAANIVEAIRAALGK